MRTMRMGEVIARSKDRTRSMLFRPFSLKKWLVLIFIAIVAGELTNGNINLNNDKEQNKTDKQAAVSAQQADQGSAAPADQAAQTAQPVKDAAKGPSIPPAVAMAFAAFAVLLILAAFLLFIYISSRFTFIWFNSVASNDVSILEPFHRHRIQGNSLFRASIFLMIMFLVTIASPVAWAVMAAAKAGALAKGFAWSASIALKLFALPVLSLIFIVIAWVIFAVAVGNFTVMIMALDGMMFLQAFRKTAQIFAQNTWDIVKFYLTSAWLSVACWFLAAVLGICVLIAFLIAGALLFGIGFLLYKLLWSSAIVAAIYGVIVAIPWFLALLIAGVCVQLPFSVFLRAFSIEYLCALNCGYSYERLEAYAKNRVQPGSKAAIVVPMVALALLVLVLLIGLLAAVAIPNILK